MFVFGLVAVDVMAASTNTWQYEIRDGVWVDMDDEFSSLLNCLQDNGSDKVAYDRTNWKWQNDTQQWAELFSEYHVDFSEMTQTNVSNGVKRRIRRIVVVTTSTVQQHDA